MNRIFISYLIYIILFTLNGNAKFVWQNLINSFALCNDYTQAGYFISKTGSSKWLIYLEGGGICHLPDNCNYRYTTMRTKLRINVGANSQFNQYSHISTLMSSPTSFLSHEALANIEGYSILSPSRKENPTFYDFNRVLVPYCSSDLWLGMGTESAKNSNKTSLYQFVFDDRVTKQHQFTFRGSLIVKSLIQELISNENMNTSQVVFGGSSAGGIGAIVHAKYFQQHLSSTANFSVFGDSAWFLDFQNNFRILPGSVLSFSIQSHESCLDTSQNIPCCISASCMFNSDTYHFPKDIPVFMSISIYDAYLLNETLSDKSYSQNRLLELLRIISEFGGAMNTSLQAVGINDNLSLFISSCFQHVFLVTSSLWGNGPDSLYSSDYEGSLNSKFKIQFIPAIWTDYKMKLDNNIDPLKRSAINLRDAFTDWSKANKTSVIFRENCKSPHCNHLCPEMIILGIGEEYWSNYAQYAIITLVLSITMVSIIINALLHLWHLLIRRYQKRLVDKQKIISKKMQFDDIRRGNNFAIMHCLPNDTITLACHDIEYRVNISLQAAKILKEEEECIATCVLETFDTINDEIQQSLDRKANLVRSSALKSSSRFFDPPTPSSTVSKSPLYDTLERKPNNFKKASRRYEIWKSHLEGNQGNIHTFSNTEFQKNSKNKLTQNVIQNFNLDGTFINNAIRFPNPSRNAINSPSYSNNDINKSTFIHSPLDNKMRNIQLVSQIEKCNTAFKNKYPEIRNAELYNTKTSPIEKKRKYTCDYSSPLNNKLKTTYTNISTPYYPKDLNTNSVISSECTDETVLSNNPINHPIMNDNYYCSNKNANDELKQNCISITPQIQVSNKKRQDSVLTLAKTLEGIKENTSRKQNTNPVLHDIIRTNKQNILKNVSALFKTGEMVAIMGPSGSGKTTLLDILAGRRYVGECTGHVFVNGYDVEEVREWFIVNSGYVLQIDQPYYQEMTVRENLTLSAITRLPSDMKLFEKLERVEEVLRETLLIEHANTKVGGLSGPGLSGGQKKRLSLAVQLLKRPSLLFLDEPTSGLDATSSYELLSFLNRFAESRRTIILSIHQPRFEIFHLFTQIILLCRGQVAYHGEPSKAYETFVKAHHTFKKTRDITIPDIQKHNPADVIMDFLDSKNSRSAILAYYQLTKGSETIANDIFREQFEKRKNFGSVKDSFKKPKSSTFLNRIAALESRAILRSSWSQLLYLPFVFILYGLLLGSAYKQASEAILIISGFCVYSVASSLFMFPIMYTYFGPTLKIFAQEQADGIAYAIDLIVQSFFRFVSLAFIPVVICAVILYLFIIRVESWDPWVLFQLVVINVALNHAWVSLLMCLIFIFPTIAHRISPIISAVAGFAGGFFVPIRLMPVYYQWLFFINPNFYGFSASARIILDTLKLECAYESELECYSSSGNYTLQNFDFINVKPYRNVIILEGMTFFFIICSFLTLSMRFFNFRRLFKRRTKEESEMITEFKYRERQLKYESKLIRLQDSTVQQNNKKLMDWEVSSQEQENNYVLNLAVVNNDSGNKLKSSSNYVPDMFTRCDSTLESIQVTKKELIKSKIENQLNKNVSVKKNNSFNLKIAINPNMPYERISHAKSLTNLNNDKLNDQIFDKDKVLQVMQYKVSEKDDNVEMEEFNILTKEKFMKLRRNASVKNYRTSGKNKYSDSYIPGIPTKVSEESDRTLHKNPNVSNDESILKFVLLTNPIYSKSPPTTMARDDSNVKNFSKNYS